MNHRQRRVQERNDAISWVRDHLSCWQDHRQARDAMRLLEKFPTEPDVVGPLTALLMRELQAIDLRGGPVRWLEIWLCDNAGRVLGPDYVGHSLVSAADRSAWVMRALVHG